MKQLLAFHLSQWIFEPRHIRASKTLKPQTASAQLETASKTSKNAENMVDSPLKCINMISDARIKGKTYEKIYMRQASCCTLASSLEYAAWPSKSERSVENAWNMLRLCCFQRDPLVTWLVQFCPTFFQLLAQPPLQSEDGAAGNKPIPTKKVTRTFSMEAKKCMPRKGKAFGKPSGTLHALEFCMLSQAPI